MYPENIFFIKTNLESLFNKINILLNTKIPLNTRKICDLKPIYGHIFKDHIKGYVFWGCADLDIIWGRINKFIDYKILDNYDIISSRKNAISGHFTLFRNIKEVNFLFKKIPGYKKYLNKKKGQVFDEFHFNNYIKDQLKNSLTDLKIYWPKYLLNVERNIDSHQEFHLDKWLWKNGKVINYINNQEIMYLHFINWKNTINKNEIYYNINTKSFFVSFNRIHRKKNKKFIIIINKFKNIFFGYWVKESRRIFYYNFFKKYNFLKKSLKKKISG